MRLFIFMLVLFPFRRKVKKTLNVDNALFSGINHGIIKALMSTSRRSLRPDITHSGAVREQREGIVHKGTAAFTENLNVHNFGPFPRSKRGLKLLCTNINSSSICAKPKLVLSLAKISFPAQSRR